MIKVYLKTSRKNRAKAWCIIAELMRIVTPINKGCSFAFDGDKGIFVDGSRVNRKDSFAIASAILNYAETYSQAQQWQLVEMEVSQKYSKESL
jgi:hypothetical protein